MGVLVTSKIYTERVKHWHLLALISGRLRSGGERGKGRRYIVRREKEEEGGLEGGKGRGRREVER